MAVFAGYKKVVVLQKCCFRPIAFSPFSLPTLSSLLKLPNRPFYRYGGHIELIRFKEYCLYFRALFGTFFRKVFLA